LALKPEGKDRGYHVSVGQLAREKYGLDLDSAHILADQFLGSGYKSALNLLVTSGPFNKQTMKKAEDSIKDKIRTIQNDNQNKIVTFDMTVTATFEVLPDDKLIETLKEVKPELNNDDNALNATLRKLNEKQDPRRCEKVSYEAYMFIGGKREGRPLQAETANADKWLNDLFKK
jgi:hypothetical protein